MIGVHPWFIEELARRIENEQMQKSIGLGRREAADYVDYSYGCGVIAGLELAKDIAAEIVKDMEK